MAEKYRLMSVHAHPDDESSKGAATLLRYIAEGHEVMVVSCTGGERGSIQNPAMDKPGVQERMGELRKEEMATAAKILGIQHRWLGFEDSGLPKGDPKPPLPQGCFAKVPLEESSKPLVGLIREFRPHVLVTYDEKGGYPHPDHIRAHEVTMAAFDAASDAGRFAEMGGPWQAMKLYYLHGIARSRIQAFHDVLTKHGMESPYGEPAWLPNPNWPDVMDRVTTRVVCSDYYHTRDEALRAHATQIDPASHWFATPLDLQCEVWPTEEYELARSLVKSTLPEDDLFAGLGKQAGK